MTPQMVNPITSLPPMLAMPVATEVRNVAR
jgi:hypothetical protein